MQTNVTSPALHHIIHPLADKTISEQALSTFTDSDIAEYTSEYTEYRSAQSVAVTDMHELVTLSRSLLKAMFGEDSKQTKYLERAIRNGETLTDRHSRLYCSPSTLNDKIVAARKQYCNFLSEENAPKSSGDNTLQEINNATIFLLGKDFELNSDFTISNAVAIAQTVASQEFDDNLQDEQQIPASNFHMVLKGVSEFDTSRYSVIDGRGSLRLRMDDMNYERPASVQGKDSGSFSYTISFADVADGNPLITLCSE